MHLFKTLLSAAALASADSPVSSLAELRGKTISVPFASILDELGHVAAWSQAHGSQAARLIADFHARCPVEPHRRPARSARS